MFPRFLVCDPGLDISEGDGGPMLPFPVLGLALSSLEEIGLPGFTLDTAEIFIFFFSGLIFS